MLHLEFRERPYMETKIEIVPDNEGEIPDLREMLRNFDIENPAKTFATNEKSGVYKDMSDDEVEDRAKLVNILAEIWNVKEMDGAQPSLNAMLILSRLMQAYINLKLELEWMDTPCDDDFEDDDYEIFE